MKLNNTMRMRSTAPFIVSATLAETEPNMNAASTFTAKTYSEGSGTFAPMMYVKEMEVIYVL